MPRKSQDAPLEMKASYVKDAIEKLESAREDRESARGTYRNRIGQIARREDLICEEAARKGIPTRPLKQVVKIRTRRASAQAIIDECDDLEERAQMLMMIELNGDENDLPLFAAARERAAASNGDGQDFAALQ